MQITARSLAATKDMARRDLTSIRKARLDDSLGVCDAALDRIGSRGTAVEWKAASLVRAECPETRDWNQHYQRLHAIEAFSMLDSSPVGYTLAAVGMTMASSTENDRHSVGVGRAFFKAIDDSSPREEERDIASEVYYLTRPYNPSIQSTQAPAQPPILEPKVARALQYEGFRWIMSMSVERDHTEGGEPSISGSEAIRAELLRLAQAHPYATTNVPSSYLSEVFPRPTTEAGLRAVLHG